MSADLPALLKRFSVAADARPAHALHLWISIVAHRDWAALAQDRARLDRLAVVRPHLATRFRAAVAARNAVSDLPGWRSASLPS